MMIEFGWLVLAFFICWIIACLIAECISKRWRLKRRITAKDKLLTAYRETIINQDAELRRLRSRLRFYENEKEVMDDDELGTPEK